MKRVTRTSNASSLGSVLVGLSLLCGCGGSVNVPIELEFVHDSELGDASPETLPTETDPEEDSEGEPGDDVAVPDSSAGDDVSSSDSDTGADSLEPADTGSGDDTMIADAEIDSGVDSLVADSVVADTGAADTMVVDTTVVDSAVADTSVADTAMPDTAVVDSAMPDTFDAGADTGPGIISLSIADVTVAEGNAGITSAMFVVTLSAPATKVVTVQYATSDGTATAFGAAFSGGKDYSATSGLLTFGIGETSKTIYVPILGDTVDEDNEDFTVTLSSPVNAVIADGTAKGTITNDDVLPGITIEDGSATEGLSGQKSITFNLTLSAASGRTVSVNYATSDGTATVGSDYVAASGSVVFEPGSIKKTIQVQLYGDSVVEPDETFFVTLTSPKNVTLADGVATGKIVNDD